MDTTHSPAAGVSAVDTSAPAREFRLTAFLGPGLIVAAAGIGSGDVVSATVGGATYGVTLLWAIGLGAFFKFVLTEGIARWQLATGHTLLEGWALYLPAWVKAYFGLYLVLWTFAVTAALTNATGLGIANLTGGAIPQSWGAVAHSFIGARLRAGRRICRLRQGDQGARRRHGLQRPGVRGADVHVAGGDDARPRADDPAGAGVYVLSLIGGIGGSITMLGYSYWMREEKIAGAGCLRFVRGDLSVAYIFTAMFGMAVMLISHRAFFVSVRNCRTPRRCPGWRTCSGSILGPFGFWAYAVGFWACVFASLLGVWQSVPYLYADFYGAVKKASDEERRRLTQVSSVPYRLALLFVTLAPLPFAFMGRPLFIIVTYTVIGSLFIPFLAATLLYMNSRIRWAVAVPHNHWTTNALLVVILLLFIAVGARGGARRSLIGPCRGRGAATWAASGRGKKWQPEQVSCQGTAYRPKEKPAMGKRLTAIALGAAPLGILLAAAPAVAHHAFAADFDANQPVTLTGAVSKIEWVNPHSWIHIDVKGSDGKVVTWAIETIGPNALMRRGWKRDTLKIGDVIVVNGYKAKNGMPVANGRSVKLPNGQDMAVGASAGAAAPRAASNTPGRLRSWSIHARVTAPSATATGPGRPSSRHGVSLPAAIRLPRPQGSR